MSTSKNELSTRADGLFAFALVVGALLLVITPLAAIIFGQIAFKFGASGLIVAICTATVAKARALFLERKGDSQ